MSKSDEDVFRRPSRTFTKTKKKSAFHSGASTSNASNDTSEVSRNDKHSQGNNIILKPIPRKRTNLKPVDVTSDDISEITNSEQQEITNISDVRSYRDKIKHRFQSVKEKSYKSLPRTPKAKFVSHADNIISLNRSVELMKKKNLEIDLKLKSYKKPELFEQEEVSKTDKYHFFCESIAPNTQTEEEKEGDLTIVNKKCDFLEDDLAKSELELLWSPGRSKIVLDETFTRNLNEEGLFTPEPPNIPKRHLKLLKQRLLTDNTKWLNSAGDINFIQNPHIRTSYRPEGYSTSSKIELTYRKPYTDITELNSVIIKSNNNLELNIQSLKFIHHHLFSVEHMLQQKLIHFYDIYRDFVKSNDIQRLTNHLIALRKAKDTFNSGCEGEGDQKPKIEVYLDRIRNVREELFNKCKIYRQNVKNILFVWRSIKKLRETNGFLNTSIKLMIRKEYLPFEKETEDYDLMLNKTVDELHAEANNKLKTDDEDPPSDASQKSVSRKKIRTKVKNLLENCLKAPGEPLLHFSLSYENEITKVLETSNEILRRNEVKHTKIYFRILCNDIEICKSKPKLLSDTFDCFFNENLCLQFENIPQHLVIEIHEYRNILNKFCIAEIELQIPSKDQISAQNKLNEVNFKCTSSITYKHNGVGSGNSWKNYFKELQLENVNEDLSYTSGFVTYNLSWVANSSENTDNKAHQSFFNANGTINFEKLNEWIETTNPDPQNPKNSIIFNYLKSSEHKPSMNAKNKEYFRCNPYTISLFLDEKSKIEENIRFHLLQLRDRNEPEFVGLTIPNRLKEIPTNILSSYNRRIAEESLEENFSEDFDNEVNARRSQGRKQLRQIYTKVFQLCRNAENNLTFEDVINEKGILLVQTFIKNAVDTFFGWFQASSQPQLSDSVSSLNKSKLHLAESNFAPKITFTLNDALNIPNRFELKRKKSGRSQSSNKSDENLLETQTYIEIVYENVTIRSSVKSGKNPVWNEKLVLPLDPSGIDYLSPNSMNGSIIINLYDKLEDSRFLDKEIDNWLGFIEIQISAISQSTKLEGLFPVNIPTTLFGYEQEYEIHQTSTSRTNNPSKNYAFLTYLNLSISIEPNISKLSPDMNSLPTTEPSYLRDHILIWNEQFNIQQPSRKFSALALDVNGKSICITRYIKSLELPQLNDDGFDVTAEQCARYVQQIPFTMSNKFYQNIWLNVEKLLKLGIGSIIDHAIALTCYFITLNIDAWLLLGFGIPHGSTAYVLTRDYNGNNIPDHFIYDIVTARKYNVMDTFCPLQKIYCVLNETNVWGNVQRGDDTSTTRFDFSRRFDWLPLFNNQITPPSSSIQNRLVYVSSYDFTTLQTLIMKKIRKRIAKVRTQHRTVWNHYASSILERIISRMEINVLHNQTFSNITPELQELMLDNHINGCVLNTSFSNVNDVVDKVLDMKVHLIEIRDAEFALAVHIHPYPNQVLSIWLAIGCIIKLN